MPTSQTLAYIVGGVLVLYVLFTFFRSSIDRGRQWIAQTRKRRILKPLSADEVIKIERYLLAKQGRSRDLALLFVLYETGLDAPDIGRLTLHDQPAKLAIEQRTFRLSEHGSKYLSQWIAAKQLKPGDIVFTREKSGKPMPNLFVVKMVWRWRDRIADPHMAMPTDSA